VLARAEAVAAFIDDVDDLRDDADRLESRIARLEATRADAARRPRTP
jgi:ubiquinone biosynthesis protein UbiJ